MPASSRQAGRCNKARTEPTCNSSKSTAPTLRAKLSLSLTGMVENRNIQARWTRVCWYLDLSTSVMAAPPAYGQYSQCWVRLKAALRT